MQCVLALGLGNRAGEPLARAFGHLAALVCSRAFGAGRLLADPGGSSQRVVILGGFRQPRWGTRWRGHAAIWPRLCAAELSAPATVAGWLAAWLAGWKFGNA